MDQTTFYEQLIINYSFIIQPGTTVRIPLNLAPAPYLPDGLYNNEDNNLVRITTNTDTCPLQLRNNQPISGVTVQLLNHEDNRKTPKLKTNYYKRILLIGKHRHITMILQERNTNPQQIRYNTTTT